MSITAQFPQIATTVPAEWLMKEADRRKMGDRLQELREQSPYEQADMAKRLPSPKKTRKHMSTRMYQRIEQRGTTKWEQVQKIAAIHAKHRGEDPKALAYWIWSGKERAATPNLVGPKLETRLTQIEEKLDDVIAVLQVLAPDAVVPAVADAAQSTPESGPLPVPEPASNASGQAGGKRRAERR